MSDEGRRINWVPDEAVLNEMCLWPHTGCKNSSLTSSDPCVSAAFIRIKKGDCADCMARSWQ